MHRFHNISKIICPLSHGEIKGPYTSKSHKLFLELGLTQFNNGIGTLLPFLMRPLRKLETLIRQKMEEISALEIMLPTLTQAKLFEKSDKLNLPELFKLKDRHGKNYILSPTNEEAVAHMISSVALLSEHQFPCRLYQITKKFRDEKRLKCGFLRSREFIMKDLYSFDSSDERNKCSYEEIVDKYHEIFQFLKIPYVCVKGLPGSIGGSISNEFHFISDVGDDRILSCKNCGHQETANCVEGESLDVVCQKCQSNNVEVMNGIEVGHTFNLGTKYTKMFNTVFQNKDKKPELLHMSCFGLGLTRLIAAAVEVLCNSEQIRWPVALAPYLICILPPKAGSKEEKEAGSNLQLLYQHLKEGWGDDVIVDDRTTSTIGKRLIKAKQMGFPFIVVIGKSITEQPALVEVQDLYSGSVDYVQISDVNQLIRDKYESYTNTDQSKVSEHIISVNIVIDSN